MTRAARVYDFTLTAGGSAVILAEGSFYRLMSATGAVEVRRNNGSIIGPLLPGQGERCEFNSLTISDKSGAVNVGSVLIADDTFIDERIAGEVTTMLLPETRAIAGQCFSGSGWTGPVVGAYSHVQLWNPAASGKLLIVRRIMFSGFGALGGVRVRPATAQLAVATFNPQNKRPGGPASVAQMFTEDNVALLGNGQFTAAAYAAANTLQQIQFDAPLIISSGAGVLIHQWVVNSNLSATFEYDEVNA